MRLSAEAKGTLIGTGLGLLVDAATIVTGEMRLNGLAQTPHHWYPLADIAYFKADQFNFLLKALPLATGLAGYCLGTLIGERRKS